VNRPLTEEIKSSAQNVVVQTTVPDDALEMVRQARKIRPEAGMVTIAEFTDVAVIGILGGIIFGLAIGVVSCMIPGATSNMPAIIGCSFVGACVGAILFIVSAIIPIFFPAALLILQIASGTTLGAIVYNGLCAYFGVNPATAPLLAQLANIFLTIVLSVLPVLACPLYFAVTLSSRWQTSPGWSLVGLMVCDQYGHRASFGQAFKRTILRLFWPIMFPGTLRNSNLIDDWVEDHSKTVLVLKPQNLKAAMIRASDEVHKSKDRIVIVSHNALMHSRVREQQLISHNVSSTISAEAIKKLLKPDWQSVILRIETYFVLMLALLFTARCVYAYWTQVYFSGYHQSNIFMALPNFVAEHPLTGPAILVLFMIGYLGMFFLARRSIPQVLKMTPQGFSVSSTNIKNAQTTIDHLWQDVVNVYLEDRQTKEQEEKWLVFSMRNEEPVKVRLDIIRSLASKEEILRAVERWAPQASRDAELVSFLQPPSDFSYTDIWMDALSAPPKRDKLKPLIAGALLKDDQYKIVKLIAVGGQGSVYLAQDSLSCEEIVLKEFVLPVYVDLSIRRKTIERFEKEARLLKHLDHQQVVKLLDFFVDDHRAYLVLEHLDGKNLRDMVQQSGPIAEPEVVSLALQMCNILHYLHKQEPPVIHRDFTPDNLILGKDGKLRLIDFNVAQSLDNAATTTGTVVGKPSYLAPEQFQGEPTPLSDQYSMGATLYYILTAKEPKPIAQSHPAEVLPTISANMNTIVSTCTSYDMALRYQSVEDLEKALNSLCQTKELSL